MSKSIGQKIRKQLDLPWKNKNKIILLFFPLIILIALVIHIVSKRRRKKSYSQFNSSFNLKLNDCKIICIGNIILGGTGKSPIVRKCALEYLNQGYIVAIASRGVGKNITPINVSKNCSADKLSLLSDENREHYEILKYYSPKNSKFYILQSPKRIKSLKFFLNEILVNNYNINKAIFILDDGLQHFSCPRNYNLCVWSPEILLDSPNFCVPIGPYREGFGKESFKNLLNKFDFRFWSRTKLENTEKYKEKIINSLKKYDINPNKKDIIVNYKNIFYNIDTTKNNTPNINTELDENQFKNYFYESNSITIITGIAKPEKFINDLKFIINNKTINHIFLDDHSCLTNQAIHLLNISKYIIITLKDFYRWHQNPKFYESIKNKKIIGCTIDANLLNFDCNVVKFQDII